MKRLNFAGMVFVTCCVLFSIYCMSFVVSEIFSTYNLSVELTELTAINEEAHDTQDKLEKEIKDYNDINYVLTIATAKYYMTKSSDDQIFLVATEDTEETVVTEGEGEMASR